MTSSNSKVFIIGSGYVGTTAAELLKRSGYSVSTARRSIDSHSDFQIDVLNPSTFPEQLLDAQIIIYSVSADSYSDESYQAAYVEGLKNVLSFLETRSNKLERFIFVSSTGVYAQSDGEMVTEASETRPTSFAGKRLLEGESLLKTIGSKGVILRLAGIYGPGRDSLLNEVRSGREFGADRLENFSNRIHRDDCARILLFLSEAKSVSGVYIGCDTQPATIGEIVHWLAGQLGLSIKISQVSQNRVMERGNKRCSSQLLTSEGFDFIYPTYKEGFLQILTDRP